MRVALLSAPDWRNAIPEARERGAELICLPHLSFSPYVAAVRDRDGLEHAERPVSRNARADRRRLACRLGVRVRGRGRLLRHRTARAA